MDKYLLERIKYSGFKQKYLAEKLGIHPNYMSRCLRGDTKLSKKKTEMLEKLVAHIEVPVN